MVDISNLNSARSRQAAMKEVMETRRTSVLEERNEDLLKLQNKIKLDGEKPVSPR